MTEHQVEERIRNGKPGYMPSFRKSLNDGQIALMAKYIKSLKPPRTDPSTSRRAAKRLRPSTLLKLRPPLFLSSTENDRRV